MAGAFQRLIARATGAPTTGLRPRLPTLFETAAPAVGFEEIQQDAVMPAHPRPQSRPAASPYPDSAQTTAPKETIADRPAATIPPLLTPKTATKPAAPDAIPSQRGPVHSGPRGTPAAQPDALLRETPAPFNRSASEPAPPNPSLSARATDAPDQTRTAPTRDAQTPPEPLLQPINQHGFERSDPQATSPTPSTRASVQSAPAAPEITIHIGQLDVRSAQPQPAPPQRPAPRAPSMPALSDYLRGRGS